MAVKEKALRRMAEKLNAANICWGIGASWLLFHWGITDSYHDFDIVVADADVEKADRVLSKLGMKTLGEWDNQEFHGEYHFDGADIDMRSPYILNGTYHMQFNTTSIAGEATVLGATVPLMHLEDWLVLYALMGKTRRVDELTAYFASHAPAHPERFGQAIAEPLPAQVQALIQPWTKE